ncbi:MAG: VCBS repeat-containing protein [Bryobacteraceae bacterium]
MNADGLLDLFVANDSIPNFLFVNRGLGKFEEIGLEAGVAYNLDGAAIGMGVDAADFNNDGKPDLFVSNFNRERFAIYRNRGNSTFADDAGVTGIGGSRADVQRLGCKVL